MRTAGLGRALLIAAVAVFAAPVLALALIVVADFDPAPDRFVVGATATSGGDVTLLLGDCAGGQLQRISVDVEQRPGGRAADAVVWAVATDAKPVDVPVAGIFEVVLGVPPRGMVETVPLDDSLLDEPLAVSVDTSFQGYGLFFSRADLEPGKVFTEGYGLVTLERFRALVGDVCDRCCLGWNSISAFRRSGAS